MNKLICLLFLAGIFASCGVKNPAILSSTTNYTSSSSNHEPFVDISEYSKEKNYGISGDFPVKVGERSVSNQRRYLASLAGPNGEELSFFRRGSCCPYESEAAAAFGSALVDVYEVSYEDLKDPILVYISFYDYETLYIPKGFTKREL